MNVSHSFHATLEQARGVGSRKDVWPDISPLGGGIGQGVENSIGPAQRQLRYVGVGRKDCLHAKRVSQPIVLGINQTTGNHS